MKKEKYMKRDLAKGVKPKMRRRKINVNWQEALKQKRGVKQGLGVLQNNFYARATNQPKRRTLPMICDFSQQILTLLEGTYFHATRLKLP
jgi:hypothetical protein